ncbi:MAG TPA: TetR/AcrR family transcriptional regulator [Crenalkalicoccus sp.]|nr:TetR/AcrR family transcriptional regulator [Crenalkalicoccus sp.]
MKVSGAKVAENRAALIATAKRLIQEKGFEGAGVAEISREAGLTQGALYCQFGSKDALAAEAFRKAFADGAAIWSGLCDSATDPLSAFLDAYLSGTHVGEVGSGCALAACISEVRRQDEAVGAAFADGFRAMVEMVRSALPKAMPPEAARRCALALVSALVGSVAMARAVEATDRDLAREIIAAAREELGRLAAGASQPCAARPKSP